MTPLNVQESFNLTIAYTLNDFNAIYHKKNRLSRTPTVL